MSGDLRPVRVEVRREAPLDERDDEVDPVRRPECRRGGTRALDVLLGFVELPEGRLHVGDLLECIRLAGDGADPGALAKQLLRDRESVPECGEAVEQRSAAMLNA